MVHCYNKNGLLGLAFVDRAYPLRGAFSVINKVRRTSSETLKQRLSSLYLAILVSLTGMRRCWFLATMLYFHASDFVELH
jgi:hypothetical protein